jgi:hypothetical protein
MNDHRRIEQEKEVQNMRNRLPSSRMTLDSLIIVLVFGSLWGFLEATLGGSLNLIHLPQKGAIMAGIGMSVMAAFVATSRKPGWVIGVGFVAASFKALDALILHVPLSAPMVMNPALAIVIEVLAFGVAASFLFRVVQNRNSALIACGVTTGFLSIALYALTASLLGLGKWPAMDMLQKLTTIGYTGAISVAIGTLLLLGGYSLGAWSRQALLQMKAVKPKLFYSSVTTATSLCWGLAAVAFIGGL